MELYIQFDYGLKNIYSYIELYIQFDYGHIPTEEKFYVDQYLLGNHSLKYQHWRYLINFVAFIILIFFCFFYCAYIFKRLGIIN